MLDLRLQIHLLRSSAKYVSRETFHIPLTKQWAGLRFAMSFVVSWYFKISLNSTSYIILFITAKIRVENVATSDDFRRGPSP